MECAICWGNLDCEPEMDPAAKKVKLDSDSSDAVPPKTPDIAQLKCGHRFHKECIMNWFKRGNPGQVGPSKGTCPTCHTNVNEEDFSSSKPVTAVNATESQASGATIYGTGTACAVHQSRSDLLIQRVNTLEKENKDLREQLQEERERADLNEAIVNSLQAREPNPSKKIRATYNIQAPKSGEVTLKIEADENISMPAVHCINVNFGPKGKGEEAARGNEVDKEEDGDEESDSEEEEEDDEEEEDEEEEEFEEDFSDEEERNLCDDTDG